MKKIVILALLLISAFFVFPFNGQASVEEEIAARRKEIEELQRQIAEYQNQILEVGGRAKTLNGEISRLNAQISKIQLEIQSLNLSITQTDSEISVTEKSIIAAGKEIEIHKKALSDALMALYRSEKESLVTILVENSRLSDFFVAVKSIEDAQRTLQASIAALNNLKLELENRQLDLEGKRTELSELKALQESQRYTLGQSRSTKNELLRQTKGDETRYQSLLTQSQEKLRRIQEQIAYLQRSGITVEDAVSYGKLTASRVGIRPAFLLAILEIETRLGQNVGSGNWQDDMYLCYLRLAEYYPSRRAYYTKRAEDEKAAFLYITSRLGLDPNSVKVSKEPSYGCGGAMGPAQFIPTTWRGYEERISRYTGHAIPNPWSVEDSFMAASIKLANDGATAQTREAEIRAAKSYISGNANCFSQICNYYANLALDKAAIIEQNL